MQVVAEGSGLVAGDDTPALGNLFLHPRQQSLGREALGRLGTAAVILHGHDVPVQMHVQRQLERARLSEVIYRLRLDNRRSRNVFVMHMGREFIRGYRARSLPSCFLKCKRFSSLWIRWRRFVRRNQVIIWT